MHAVGTLAAMVPASEGTFAQPVFRITRKGFSFKISRIKSQDDGADDATEGEDSSAGGAEGAATARQQFSGADRQQTLQRFLDTARASMAHRGPGRPSAGAAAGFHSVDSMVGRVESAPAAAAGLQPPSVHAYAPKRAFSTAGDGAASKDVDADVESPAEGYDKASSRLLQAAITRGCSTHRLGSLSASNLAPGLVSGKWSGRWGSMRHRASMRHAGAALHHSGADVHVDVQQTGRRSTESADPEAARGDVAAEGPSRDQQLQQVVFNSLAAKRWKRAALGKEAGGLSAIMERAESEMSGLSPLQAQQVSAKLAALDEGALGVCQSAVWLPLCLA